MMNFPDEEGSLPEEPMPTPADEHAPPKLAPTAYQWTPKQRNMLVSLRERFWSDAKYVEDRRMAFGDRRLEFVKWLVERGYFSENFAEAAAEAA